MTSHAKDGWAGDEEPSEAQPADPDPVGFDDLPPPPDPDRGPLDEALAYGEADLSDFEQDFGSGAAGLVAERDQYRDALLRVKADFDNYKKRVAKDQAATVERAAEKIVAELLPVLDACEAALGHGASDVEPIFKSLSDTLEKGGLERMHPEGHPFDPNLHEAVMHEPGDGDETLVVEVMRSGYLWNGRVVRPAMVRVRG